MNFYATQVNCSRLYVIRIEFSDWKLLQKNGNIAKAAGVAGVGEELCMPGGNSHMKQTGMLVGNFEFNPQRRPIWAWLKQILTP